MPPESSRSEQRIWAFLIIGMTLILGVSLINFLRPRTQPLPTLADAPVFELTAQTGERFSSASLAGKVWMASFVFTRCRGICPLIVESKKRVAGTLDSGDPWLMVSFSVDPEYDTPEVLAEYARDLDPGKWVFLTGEKAPLYEMITKGFLLGVEDEGGTEQEPILHSQKIALVDAWIIPRLCGPGPHRGADR